MLAEPTEAALICTSAVLVEIAPPRTTVLRKLSLCPLSFTYEHFI